MYRQSNCFDQIQLTMARVIRELGFKAAEGDIGRIGAENPHLRNGRHKIDEHQLKASLTIEGTGPFPVFSIEISVSLSPGSALCIPRGFEA